MLRKHLITVSAISLLALGAFAANNIHGTSFYDTEPILIVHVGGGTLSGPVAGSLMVYSDGQMMMSGLTGTTGPTVGTAKLSLSQVNDLTQAMRTTHMHTLDDQDNFVFDVPVTTVTSFLGNAQQSSNTFSYTLAVGSYAAVADAINGIVNSAMKAP